MASGSKDGALRVLILYQYRRPNERAKKFLTEFFDARGKHRVGDSEIVVEKLVSPEAPIGCVEGFFEFYQRQLASYDAAVAFCFSDDRPAATEVSGGNVYLEMALWWAVKSDHSLLVLRVDPGAGPSPLCGRHDVVDVGDVESAWTAVRAFLTDCFRS
jgi:hypothetical protein